VQFHLAGHSDCTTHLIDTHDNHVTDPVWELYRLSHQLTGGVSTLLEWDASIPPFDVVHAEVLKAKQFMVDRLPGADALGRPGIAGSSQPDRPVTPAAQDKSPHPLHHVLAEVD
jgi:hypothetical protein